jgi:hypothetical protein
MERAMPPTSNVKAITIHYTRMSIDWWIIIRGSVTAITTYEQLGEEIAVLMGTGHSKGRPNNIYGPFTYNPCEKLLAERVDWDALQLLSDEQVEEYRKKNVKGQGDTNPECCYLVNNQWVCW